jgi:hypothetical protein
VVFPLGSALVVILAVPPLNMTVPSVVVPAVKVTVPVILAVGLVTVAENLTG